MITKKQMKKVLGKHYDTVRWNDAKEVLSARQYESVCVLLDKHLASLGMRIKKLEDRIKKL